MLVNLFLWLLFIHWVADFVLQNDWMAINKSRNVLALSTHVAVYSGYFWFILWFMGYPVTWEQIATLFGAHFITDAITSNATAYLWKREARHWFFVVIGFDQFLHFAQIRWIFL